MLTIKEKSTKIEKINKENEQLKKFRNAINFANEIIVQNNSSKCCTKESLDPHPLVDVIRILGRGLQSEYLCQLLLTPHKPHIESIQFWSVFFDNCFPIKSNYECYGKVIRSLDIKKDIDLSKDLVLPSPWCSNRYIKSISNIGKGRPWGEWNQDTNHDVTLLLPLGVVWVNSGNHSISTGIIQGKGIIETTKVYDISPLYEYVECDGLNYRRISDGAIISKVENVEFAAIFEIGRLMTQHSISF